MENVSASVSAAIATTRPPPLPVAVAVRPVEQSSAAKNNTARSGSSDNSQVSQTAARSEAAVAARTAAAKAEKGEEKEPLQAEKSRELPAHLRDLNIEFDKATKQVVFQSLDPESGEVRHQFPTELMLKLSANFKETVGILVDDKV